MIKRALRLGLFQARGMFRTSFFFRPPTITYEQEPLAERIGLFQNRKVKQQEKLQQRSDAAAIRFSEWLKEIKQATQLLNKLDSIMLDDVCRVFGNYDPENAQQQLQTYEMLKLCLTGKPNAQQIDEIYFAVRSIVEWFDQSESGLLKGDLHSQGMHDLQKYMTKLLEEHAPADFLLIEDKIYQEVLDVLTKSNNFRLPQAGIHTYMVDNARNLYERQLILEKQSNEFAVDKLMKVQKDLQKFEKAQNMEFSRKRIVEWFPLLTKAIKEEQDMCRGDNLRGDRRLYAEQMLKIAPEKLAALALNELMKAIIAQVYRLDREADKDMYGYIRAGFLFERIGELVNCEVIFQKQERDFRNTQKSLQKQRSEIIKKMIEQRGKKQDSTVPEEHKQQIPQQLNIKSLRGYVKPEARKAHLQKLASRIMRSTKSFESTHAGISKHSKIMIGSVLTYLMKSIIKVKNSYGFLVPLLISENRKTTKTSEFASSVLAVNEDFLIDLVSQIEKENNAYLHMDRSLPTIIEPAPWVDYEIGGYYLRPTTIMRYSNSSEQQRAVKYADLSRLAGVLDILSKVAWKINPKILRVVEQVWSEGGGMCTIPTRNYNMKNYVYQFQIKNEKDIKRREQLERLIQEQRNIHSLKCDFLLKLNVAQSYLNVDKFYFPHNVDFRGRVYPIPPHLNHIGADLARGLLTFAEGVKLGPSGFKWLKIHTANLMGHDKARLHQKLEFTEKNMSLILEIANDPMRNRQWMQYEDCWQALSSILELSDAIKSGAPEQFISHLHVHQDGSCNGLQHYAALGRDSQGAAQVNLDVLDKPGDIYTHVARMVSELIERDCNNPESANHEMAKKLRGNIKRKTIKQTVMTSVYGVTFIGAREQIYRQIRDQKFLGNEDEEYQASIELAKYTMQCIKNLFDRAHNIKKWLIECAGLVTETGNPVSWITPLGLPVIQPYRVESDTDQVKTLMHSIMVSRDSSKLPINRPRQKSAFPPNFVHSLDSTHMMYTAQKAYTEGIVFAAVHDSYWTHAASVERMNEILRQQFIRLHSQPLLQNLRESFQRRFPQIKFPPVPERGNFDLERIKQSLYFFS